jgi:hypothetical protein
MGHWARMRDKNERPIIDALVAVGASVTQLNATGAPDLLVGFRMRTFLLEVKLPEQEIKRHGGGGASRKGAGGDGTLTESQVKWWGAWQGEPARVVRNVDDALRAIGVCLGCRKPHVGPACEMDS